LTGVVAATLADATGALGVLCYVRSEDGTAAEGTLWTDDACSVSCPLVAGSGAQPHATQVVTRLRPTWQKRSYRVIDLGTEGENLAHVLLWLDDLSASDEKLIQEVSTWCGFWLERVAHVARLEQQLENLAAALREQSARAEAKLEEAKLAALAEMAAGAGHEINNPLAVISGRAQLLLAEESDPRRRKALETINAQAQRIHRMIVDLMTFARPPAPICQPLTIAEVVAQALGRVKADADSRRVTITTTVNPALPQVSGDMGQLATVLECVLQNGLEAIVEDGAVEVVADSGADSTVELRISDNGPGISESQRAHVFEPFYSGREAGRGLGMGLSKAWRFVRNHKGEIQVGSSPEGTTIIVRLPALAAATEQRACA
ncbi:MAG: HAMP domain-containing histidine kinase, partial [Planctomycetes bacterium]|nr:HAMP domain-containing histidine kinase [Planctomycetota bacterium]